MNVAVVLLLGLWGSLAECSPVVFPDRLSEKELECFSNEKIYDKGTDKCYKLLTRGPCPRGHWFVLEKPKETLRGDSEVTIRGVCVRENCKDGEYFWSSTGFCAKAKDKKRLCGDIRGLELLTNVFGEGECSCTRDPPRARLTGDRRMNCYLLYTRGPCPPSKILGFIGNSDQATCIPDPCYSETMFRKRTKTLAKDAVLAAWENGTCYELGTQGPCPEGLTFKVHAKHKKPNCGVLLNHIFGGGINGCEKDQNGVCQKKVAQKKRSTADKFMKELQDVLKKKKK